MTDKKVLGFAMCGSFCTLSKAVTALESLAKEFDVIPIMSEITYSTDTRFGTAASYIEKVKGICNKAPIHSIVGAEPIGPKKMLDAMVIAPCTGNTLAKLAGGITDSAVTMAAKAHLRNERPLIIALSTNDALSGSAKNIGALLNVKNVYFVPFNQDDSGSKPRSCVSDLGRLKDAVFAALDGKQLQPIIL